MVRPLQPLPPPPSWRAFLAAHARLAWLMAGVLVLAAASYAWLGRSPVSAQAGKEISNAHALVRALWSTTPGRDFTGLSTAQAIARRQVPGGMLRATGAPVRSAWGTPVDLLPHGVRAPADGFIVRYHDLPALACVELALALGENAYDVRVDLRPVMGVSGPDPALVRSSCAGDATTVDFVFHPDLIPGTALPRNG